MLINHNQFINQGVYLIYEPICFEKEEEKKLFQKFCLLAKKGEKSNG